MLQPWCKRRPGAWSPCASRRSPRAAHAVLVAAAACSAYASSLGVGLVFDDLAAIKANRDLRQSTPIANLFFNDFWGTPLRKEQSHKSYRPLTVLTFRLNFAVHGLDPFGYHLVNLLLHALTRARGLVMHSATYLTRPKAARIGRYIFHRMETRSEGKEIGCFDVYPGE
ncbi:hypothetical protein HPB50_007880 [Hyalomma asiaticum]|uniref:Uncharacterized protein n=1 Tax=Hyalomma asiaticum TaxID=266040 RepID=A0ACB7TGE7_HYAAI|nr:hypothetical protein HPB50_007880 [Hyalomma asiaticum]